jgi:hypothetical protein
MGKCFKNTQNKKQLSETDKKKTRTTKLSLQLFLMANFDRVNGPIDMRIWKGRRIENILKLDRTIIFDGKL